MTTLQDLEQRIDRWEKMTEDLIKKVAKLNVEHFYLSQRVTALEQGYEYPTMKTSS